MGNAKKQQGAAQIAVIEKRFAEVMAAPTQDDLDMCQTMLDWIMKQRHQAYPANVHPLKRRY